MKICFKANWLVCSVSMSIIYIAISSTVLLAQKSVSQSGCDSLFKKNNKVFIESYYFSKILYKTPNKKSIDNYFRKTNLLDLDSLLKLPSFDEKRACFEVPAGQYLFLTKYYSKDIELNEYLKKHEIDDDDFLKYLYRNRKYRNIITLHFQNSNQSIYSLSESQLGMVYYNFVCYLVLDNVSVASINIK